MTPRERRCRWAIPSPKLKNFRTPGADFLHGKQFADKKTAGHFGWLAWHSCPFPSMRTGPARPVSERLSRYRSFGHPQCAARMTIPPWNRNSDRNRSSEPCSIDLVCLYSPCNHRWKHSGDRAVKTAELRRKVPKTQGERPSCNADTILKSLIKIPQSHCPSSQNMCAISIQALSNCSCPKFGTNQFEPVQFQNPVAPVLRFTKKVFAKCVRGF